MDELHIYDCFRRNAGPSKSNESCSVKLKAEEQYPYAEVIFVRNGGRKADYEMKCRKTAGHGTNRSTVQDEDGPTYITISEMIEDKL